MVQIWENDTLVNYTNKKSELRDIALCLKELGKKLNITYLQKSIRFLEGMNNKFDIIESAIEDLDDVSAMFKLNMFEKDLIKDAKKALEEMR